MSESEMEPTLPSWMTWYRHVRPLDNLLFHPEVYSQAAKNAAEQKAEHKAEHAPEHVAVYSKVVRSDEYLPYFRVEEMWARDRVLPTPPDEWMKRLNIGEEMWRSQLSQDEVFRDQYQRLHEWGELVPRTRPRAQDLWVGFIAAAVLLAALALLLRAAEKCLAKKLLIMEKNGKDFNDLPPPYFNSVVNNTKNKIKAEKLPPPCSACVAAFGYKDIPTVHTFGKHPMIQRCRSELDYILYNSAKTRPWNYGTGNNKNGESIRVELVCDNGRIVERMIDIDSTDNVSKIVADVGIAVICNKSLDDNFFAYDLVPGPNGLEPVMIV